MNPHQETFVDTTVLYTLELDGSLLVVENVPARECVETGERLFAPDTVEHLHQIAWGNKTPKCVLEVPVFEFAA